MMNRENENGVNIPDKITNKIRSKNIIVVSSESEDDNGYTRHTIFIAKPSSINTFVDQWLYKIRSRLIIKRAGLDRTDLVINMNKLVRETIARLKAGDVPSYYIPPRQDEEVETAEMELLDK
jgi:hypothetical protein